MREPPPKSHLFVVTPARQTDQTEQSRQTDFFTGLLKTCGYNFTIVHHVGQLPETAENDVVFYDSANAASIMPAYSEYQGSARWVLFNLMREALDESGAIVAGIEGAFYQEDPPELIMKGLRRIHTRDVWFCRSSINSAIRQMRAKLKNAFWSEKSMSPPLVTTDTPLTKRELSIVQLVSEGAQNKEIAEQLHISINTVKTHIYSIFRKTRSRNRIELLFWCQNYMNHG
ncbi:helix-turn-helix transcriptional regulator [Alteromonas antoniana]|uniref:helix-turn-helix transcriptional regulator n=1 Tax=Alteromonas antoniana TaxID=2803813 RepID=UPI00237C1359|nr:response regulator transcription factor [Alteromonas antoniana]